MGGLGSLCIEVSSINRDEFVKICIMCGYASKKNAKKYSMTKDEFTIEDFEYIHNYNERLLYIKNGMPESQECTADRLLNNLANKPAPWNHTFDASRGIKRDKVD